MLPTDMNRIQHMPYAIAGCNNLLLTFLTALLASACTPTSSCVDYLGQTPPVRQAALFSPGLISTNNYEHSAPTFSSDGKVVLWAVVDKAYRASLLEMTYEQG